MDRAILAGNIDFLETALERRLRGDSQQWLEEGVAEVTCSAGRGNDRDDGDGEGKDGKFHVDGDLEFSGLG